jgi:DNA excision repair protein ERCC-5
MALSAIGNRAQKQFPSAAKSFQKTKSTPLFDLDENEAEFPISANMLQYSSEDDKELAFAVQDSFDQKRGAKAHVIDADSSHDLSKTSLSSSKDVYTTHYSAQSPPSKRLSEEEDLFATPTRLETVLSIAGAGPSRPHHYPLPSTFGRPVLLSPSPQPPGTASLSQAEQGNATVTQDMTKPPTPKGASASEHAPDVDTISDSDEDLEEVTGFSPVATSLVVVDVGTTRAQTDSEMDMEEIIPERDVNILRSPNELNKMSAPIIRSPFSLPIIDDQPNAGPSHALQSFDNWERDDLSRSPSPFRQPSDIGSPRSRSPAHDSWDAAQEMDAHAEEGEFAHFISQVKGKDIDDVRREIDDEIKSLNQQKRAAMRDSEDITQQMISQIMVSWNLSFTSVPQCPMHRPCCVFLAFRTLQHRWRQKRNAQNWSPLDSWMA